MPEQAPDGSIIITPKEFYDGVRQDISEIKDSVSALREGLSPLPKQVEEAERRLDELETKVSTLQNRMAWFCGAGTAIGALVGTLAPIVLK